MTTNPITDMFGRIGDAAGAVLDFLPVPDPKPKPTTNSEETSNKPAPVQTNETDTQPNIGDFNAAAMARRAAAHSRAREEVAHASVTEFDPSDIDFEQATIQKKLDLVLTDQLARAKTMYDDLSATHSDDPAFLLEIQEARDSTVANMQTNHARASAQLGSNFATLRRVARAEHEQNITTREHSDIDLETKRLQNELLRLETAQASAAPDTGPFFLAPNRDQLIETYNLATLESDPNRNINEKEALALAAVEEFAKLLQYGVAIGNSDFVSPELAQPALELAKELGSADRAAIEEIIRQLTSAAQYEISMLRS